MSSQRRSRAKVYRDPVHKDINFKSEGELGELICRLIDTREMQRLRHVRQLGLAYFVFHGAEHSRFAHSLGVAHLTRRMANQLRGEMSELDRVAVVSAGLLHDIGHAPFSHVMERVFGFDHEAYSVAIIQSEESQVHQALSEVDASLPERVVGLLSKKSDHFSKALVSSQLDADRADYLLRDSHMAGIEAGRYDLERLLNMMDHDELGLVFDDGAFESIEGYLLARYHMYRLVYFHSAVRSAEAMLQMLFRRARHLIEQGHSELLPPNAFGDLMAQRPVSATAWAELGEFHAWALISTWRNHEDKILAGIARGLLERDLFKSNDRHSRRISLEEDNELVARIHDELSPNERFLFFVDEAGDLPFKPYSPGKRKAGDGIRMRDKQGRIYHIEERSVIVRALAEGGYLFRRWYFHPILRSKLQRIVGEHW